MIENGYTSTTIEHHVTQSGEIRYINKQKLKT